MTEKEERDEPFPTKDEVAARLKREIEDLYPQIEATLGRSSDEAQSALDHLDRAKAIIASSPEQLNDAFYQVGLAKATLGRRHNLKTWSAQWGGRLLFYNIIWLIIFLAGIFFTWSLGAIFVESGDIGEIMQAAMVPAMVGGIGGTLKSLVNLFRQVFIQRTFQPQYILSYIIKPVMGFFLGAVAYFIILAGFLIFEGAIAWVLDNPGQVIPIYVLIACYLVISFVAGFRQETVLMMIDKITQRLSPSGEVEEDDEPESLIPEDAPGQESGRVR